MFAKKHPKQLCYLCSAEKKTFLCHIQIQDVNDHHRSPVTGLL